MKINAALLIKLRKERAWTQDGLATIAELNLRTVQRIEKEGVASLHSKKSLAAAFEIDIHDLDYEEFSMLKELVGKTISIHISLTSLQPDQIKGEVLRAGDNWIEIKTKRNIEYVNTTFIKRIVVSS